MVLGGKNKKIPLAKVFFILLPFLKYNKHIMGKGDRRSRKGKVWRGSYGNTRKRKTGKKPAFVPKPKAKKQPVPIEALAASVPAETPVIETAVETTAPAKVAKARKPAVKKEKPELLLKKSPTQLVKFGLKKFSINAKLLPRLRLNPI